MGEKPELAPLIEPQLQEIAHQFEDLENTTSEKGGKLFDANRQVLYEQTCSDIDGWISELENQVLSAETGQDAVSLTGVNLVLQKQHVSSFIFIKNYIFLRYPRSLILLNVGNVVSMFLGSNL